VANVLNSRSTSRSVCIYKPHFVFVGASPLGEFLGLSAFLSVCHAKNILRTEDWAPTREDEAKGEGQLATG
jgi:hypothetical protein